ncbi:unnamed protein product [Coregonus sp. 'balchen']|uniref:Uncharacterized protein n=1 Tax=Coregonus suidteri TaxID=861788 RepID=A0AAN8M147_9TELE|nr:unnamed protein product [Coregonus sp. 'balchen']
MAWVRRVFGPGMSVCLWALCLSLSLIWTCQVTQAAIYRHTGPCIYKEVQFQPGQTFYRGCDKCYCHENGYFCLSPMKPTTWPNKCQRVPTECGYRIVYKELPEVECRAYSWIR